jgi:hypothetical protein
LPAVSFCCCLSRSRSRSRSRSCLSFRILFTYVDAVRTRLTENTCHVTATEPVYWRSGCCLQKTGHVTASHCCGDASTPARKCVYRAVAWQCVHKIRFNMQRLFLVEAVKSVLLLHTSSSG